MILPVVPDRYSREAILLFLWLMGRNFRIVAVTIEVPYNRMVVLEME